MSRVTSAAIGSACAAIIMTTAVAGAAQTGQTTTTTQTQAATQNQQVTITGCVQREADYRRATDAGKGGLGTGVGTGNEYILANATMSPAPASTSGTPSGSSTASQAYELTGKNEGQATPFVGKRVEIVGMLKPAEAGASGTTGGATAGAPPRGVDVASSDLRLRELEITSVRAATSGTCPTS